MTQVKQKKITKKEDSKSNIKKNEQNEEEDLNKSREAAPTSFISNKLKEKIKEQDDSIKTKKPKEKKSDKK